MNIASIARFIFELGILKLVKRSGWERVGIRDRESVPEHQNRSAQLGFILAMMEGANPEKVACMMMIHDNPEVRTGDPNRLAKKYMDFEEGQLHAFNDQVNCLPDEVRCKWLEYYEEFCAKKTQDAIVAKDADLLEMAFQAKEYLAVGYPCQQWIDDVGWSLRTDSAKKLFAAMVASKVTDWWL